MAGAALEKAGEDNNIEDLPKETARERLFI
jgi:hypothetical protein